jgi:hypothetical protein
MDCPSFALQDHPVDGGELPERRQANLTDLGTACSQATIASRSGTAAELL